jgi:D-alanyl-lipoteichoic acid acyltransferase DltB (MBOAT superfamily)
MRFLCGGGAPSSSDDAIRRQVLQRAGLPVVAQVDWPVRGDDQAAGRRPAPHRNVVEMIFNSPVFLFAFLPLSLAGYFLLMRLRASVAARAWLVLASLVFYGWWNPFYVPLLAGSIWFNYRVGIALMDAAPAHGDRRLLALGVGANLLLLAWFKYADFVVANVDALTGATIALPGVHLPLGISFFTFTQIAWLVDSRQGKVRDRSALDFTLFVTFFPHLIAGPILHHREMMSQFASRWTRAPRTRNALRGLFFFSIGLFKKVVLADTFAGWADAGFDAEAPLDFVGAWTASLSYTLQLYLDFSGYCDMAMGAALLFNIVLPVNFDSPYKSLDIQAFWRRWHITLSRYLRDYVYIPLGGNRGGPLRVCLHLMATFLLGGLWHGASGMFVAWGGLHGAALVLHRGWKAGGRPMPRPLAWVLTFAFVDVAWVFFRAHAWPDAMRMLRGMVDVGSIRDWPLQRLETADFAWAGPLLDPLLAWLPATIVARAPSLAALVLGLALMRAPNAVELASVHACRPRGVFAAATLLCVAVLVMVAGRQTPFLYFNF